MESQKVFTTKNGKSFYVKNAKGQTRFISRVKAEQLMGKKGKATKPKRKKKSKKD